MYFVKCEESIRISQEEYSLTLLFLMFMHSNYRKFFVYLYRAWRGHIRVVCRRILSENQCRNNRKPY